MSSHCALPHAKRTPRLLKVLREHENHAEAENEDVLIGRTDELRISGEAKKAPSAKCRAEFGKPKRSVTHVRPGSIRGEKALYVSNLSREKYKEVSEGPLLTGAGHDTSLDTTDPLLQTPHDDEPGNL